MNAGSDYPGVASPRVKLCTEETCHLIAEIIVAGADTGEMPLCLGHWKELSNGVSRPIAVIASMDRQLCSRPDCPAQAIAVMENVDCEQRTVCEQHWDDLSWVDTPTALLNQAPQAPQSPSEQR